MKKRDLLAVAFLFILVLVYFGRLFFPEPSVFITPELGVSDIWQLNFPLKNFLKQSLTGGEIPLWSKDIGRGFPLLAEAQIGAFYLPNILLFYFLPSWFAFNLSYLTTFILVAFSMYFLCRHFKRSVLASVFAGFIFTFSGFFIAHISHLNVIQTAAFLPLVFLLGYLLIEKTNFKKKYFFSIFALVLSQQIFAGFPQMVFLTLFALASFICFQAITILKKGKKMTKPAKGVFFLSIGFLLAILISAVQILPTFELTKLSLRKGGLSPQEVLFYSYKPEFFLTFFKPFYLGNPANGTYPDYAQFDGAIFWENIGYIGILPLFFAFYGLIRIKNNHLIQFFSFLAFISALLMLGKHSPFFVILTFAPFNFFRIHSRFILLFLFSLTILSSFGFDFFFERIKKKLKRVSLLIAFAVISVAVFDIFKVWFFYHPTSTVKEWLKEPETVTILKNQPNLQRIYSLNRFTLWRKYFLDQGWKNKEEYIYARNGLHPDWNLVFNLPQSELYSALYTKRFLITNGLVQSGFKGEVVIKNIASPSAKLLSAFGVSHLIATSDFENDQFKKIYQTEKDVFNYAPLVILENQDVLPRAYFVTKYSLAKTVSEASEKLLDPSFEPKNEVILEKEIKEKFTDSFDQDKVKIITIVDKDQQLVLQTDLPTSGILVVSDSFYPGWQAFIDNKKTEILAANLNSRAVVIDKGKHEVTFKYQPESFRLGTIVSSFALFITILILSPSLLSFLGKRLHKN